MPFDAAFSRPAPLAGIRVLSMAEQLPGPYATLLLADLGADVILVERPGAGDPARFDAPFFNALARNKRSVTIDLKSSEGRAQLDDLMGSSDVLVEGFRPGTMEKLGFGAAEVAERAPRLIYVSISGFGQDGPYRDRLGHDLSFQAVAGLMFAQAEKIDAPPEVPFADIASAMFASFAISTALYARERTGRGTYVDVAMADSLVSWMTPFLAAKMNGGTPLDTSSWPSYGSFRTSDGKLLTLSIVHEDHFWRGLCELLGLSDVATLSLPERVSRRDELRARLADLIAARDLANWEMVFDRAAVCWSPVNTLDAVVADRHIRARGMVSPITVDGREELHIPQPLKFAGHKTVIARPAPKLGEHNDEILGTATPSVR